MADPTSTISRAYEADANRCDYIIKNSEAMVVGGFAGLNRSTGLVEFMDDADDLISLGVVIGQSKGDNTLLTGDGSTYGLVARSGIILSSVAVTGASAVTDNMKPVYCTDGQTLTLTKPTSGSPVGYVHLWRTSTTCDVYLYTPQEQMTMARHGMTETRFLCAVSTNAMQANTAADFCTITSNEHYRIDSLFALPYGYDAAAVAGSQALNLEIDGTNVTGGVLTLAYTSCDAAGDMGTSIAATAITAANEVHQGDVLQLEMAASGTAFTADVAGTGFMVFMTITHLVGA